jgi:hypothetical protein
MNTVVCVLKSGGEYTKEYVDKLKCGVLNNLPDAEFICLSDMKVPDKIPLLNNYPGWWSKVEIFRITGKVLYLDLDTIVTGDLSDIFHYPHKFTMLRDFNRVDCFASGVMAWDGDYSHIYKNFTYSSQFIRPYRYHPKLGDGGYIQNQVEDIIGFQDVLPGQILSHKLHKDRSEARLVCYHGKPRPHTTGWEK